MDGYIVIGTEIDTKNFDAQIDYIQNKMEDIEYKLKQADMGFEVGDTSKLEAEYEKLGNQLLSLKQKQNDVINADWSKATIETEKTNVNLSSMVGKLSRIGLAVFGIRTAYTGVRQIMNGVLSQNEGLRKQMDNIRNSLYNAFTPAVEKIISLIKTLMTYINYVWSRLFGKNLFKNVESSSKQTSKNLSSGAKAAKEINKQLAGFDEANVLSANKTSTGGTGSVGVGSGDTTPSFKLAGEVPDWLKKIMDWVEKHPKLSKIIFGITAFTMFGLFKKNSKITDWISKLLGKKGPENGGGGSGLLGLASTLAWLAGIATIAIEIKILYDVFNKIDELNEDTIAAEKRVTSATKDSVEQNKKYNKSVVDKAKVEQLSNEEKARTISHIKETIKTNNRLIENDNQMTGIFQKNAKLSKDARSNLSKENHNAAETYYELYKNGQLTADEEKDYYKFLISDLNPGMENVTEKGRDMNQAFKDLQGKYGVEVLTEFKETGISTIKDAFSRLGDMIKGIFSNTSLANIFAKIGGGLSSAFTNAKNVFKKVFKADGGIVNMPGRGVPITYAGERGREGIVPMDNRSQMAILGQEIAKYVTINNYVTNNVDSRKLNTILQQSASRERLANNG